MMFLLKGVAKKLLEFEMIQLDINILTTRARIVVLILTMNLEGTMIMDGNWITEWRNRINTRLVKNLAEKNDVLRLPATKQKNSTPEIAGLEIQLNREGESTLSVRSSAIEVAMQSIHYALPDWQIWLLSCHTTWQPNSRIVSYRKLWKSLEARGLKLPKGYRTKELEFKTDEGQRWFGGIEIETDEISLVGPIINDEPSSIITAFPKGTVPDLKAVMDAGWISLRDSRLIGWTSIATMICEVKGLLLRPFGEFDDILIGIDILTTWSLATKIHEVLVR